MAQNSDSASVHGQLLKQLVMFLFPYQIKNYSVNMKQNNSNWFSVMLIIQFAILFVCSSALNFEKSNDTQTHLFPVSLIHINDFHARYYGLDMILFEFD